MNETETVSLQNYLASFYEEIKETDEESQNETNKDSHFSQIDETIVDTPKSPEESTEVLSTTVDSGIQVDGNDSTEINNDEQPSSVVASITKQPTSKLFKPANAKVVPPDGSYQAVTIVPSDTNPGELSYVLFVANTEDCKDAENIRMTVHEIDSKEKISGALVAECKDGVKKRTLRLAARQRQVGTRQHICRYCPYTTPKRYLLHRHMKSHSDDRPHKCGICERGFKTLASLQNHVNTHTGTRPHMCKECAASFTTSGELVRHMRYKHTHEKPHKCEECDYASVELSKLKRHMLCHTGERPYQCPRCAYASSDTYKLKRHLRIHTGERPFECDICQARFTQSNSLKAHKLIHEGRKPTYQCEYCPTTCGRKTDLRIHMEKLHSIDKPHKCRKCNKVFLDRYSYKVHIRSHDGEKCFKCDLCEYASVSAQHLQAHMFLHTNEKPFKCTQCEQSFRQLQLLKRHLNLYHNPNYVPPVPGEKNNICQICAKAFRHKGNLLRHQALHDPSATEAEKDDAMRIGLPKGPNQLQDGEEDEEECEIHIKEEIEDEKEDQVVVFEVIQLPSNATALQTQNSVFTDNAYFYDQEEDDRNSIVSHPDNKISEFINMNELCEKDNASTDTHLNTMSESAFRANQIKAKQERVSTVAKSCRPRISHRSSILQSVNKALGNDSDSRERIIIKDITLKKDQSLQNDMEECFDFMSADSVTADNELKDVPMPAYQLQDMDDI